MSQDENPPSDDRIVHFPVEAARRFEQDEFVSFDTDDPIDADTVASAIETTNFPRNADLSSEPARRLIEMVHLHGNKYALQELDKYLLKYELTGTPYDVIGKDLDLPVSVVTRLMRDMKRRWALKADQLDVLDLMGEALRSFQLTKQEAMKILMKPTTSNQDKIKAIAAINKGDITLYELLEKMKVFERKNYNPSEDEKFTPAKQADQMLDMLENIFNDVDMENDKAFKEIEDERLVNYD